MKKLIPFLLALVVVLLLATFSFSSDKAPDPITIDGASVTAKVDKLTGNQNRLWITVTDTKGTTTENFMIDNNAAGTYQVGNYGVYVDTKGNTQIRTCYFVSYAGDGNKYALTIDTAAFIPLDEYGESFVVEDKINAITGTLSRAVDAISLQLKISAGALVVSDTTLNISANWQFANPNLVLEATNTITVIAGFKDGTVIEKSIRLVNYCEDNFNDADLDTADDDGDGIPNWLEDVIGTDKNKADTDGDGLSDYDEMYKTFTNPLVRDTDGNGISDGEEDFDGDGLNNIQECYYGTNPFNTDTDGDSLSDYDEVFIYHSDPLKVDSDDDGLPDILEIKYGMDPKNPDTLGDGILDGDRIFTFEASSEDTEEGDRVKPSLIIELQGKLIETLAIKKVRDDDMFLSKWVPGYIGNAFDFRLNGDFESALLTFEFDSTLLDDSNFIPSIYYWNEDEQLLEEVIGQTVTGNKVSVQTKHFSKYILLNRVVYEGAWNEKDIKPPNFVSKFERIDLALVIDNSGSMDADSSPKNDPTRLRHKVAKDLIDKLGDNDKICVVNFQTTAVLQTSFTSNKQTAKNAVDNFINGGTTALYNGVNVANNQFAINSSDKAFKIMIVLTDGMDNASTVSLTTVTQAAVRNNVIIYTVGLGSTLDAYALTSLAQLTGGQYYHASAAEELIKIFDKIAEEDVQIDSDQDGLPDYFEKLINDGTLTLGSGVAVYNREDPNSVKLSWNDPQKKDSDGDGLNDGEEATVVEKKYPDGTSKIWVYITSNPCLVDSDKDHLPDDLDPEPLKHFYPYVPEFNQTVYTAKSFNGKRTYCLEINKEVYDSFKEIDRLRDLPEFKNDRGKKAIDEARKEIHYFRNELNYEPSCLTDLLKKRNEQNWKPFLASGTVYHMEGKYGGFNMKWMTPPGEDIFEAVYGIGGKLLSKHNDPNNMGTYNYGYTISTGWLSNGHDYLDVEPYMDYGNMIGYPPIHKSGTDAWIANYFKCREALAYGYRIAMEDRHYSYEAKNGIITNADTGNTTYYVLIGDSGSNTFKIKQYCQSRGYVFAMGCADNDTYEIDENANAIIYDTEGNNTLRFNFSVDGVVSSSTNPTISGKYLKLEKTGENIEFYVRNYDTFWGWSLSSKKICTLYSGTSFYVIQDRYNGAWRTII
ncbi:MAG: VWA domain-containing protein [Prevotellaceae bacterium]|jgi:Mg-chelatase subunit ChlD|nr:VWA domain-containing protein [Prevotellaceae bacterium]